MEVFFEVDHYLRQLLPVYFSRLFPFEDFYRWLSYGEEETFSLREFAFIFEGERFLRNQAFKDVNHFRSTVKQHKPIKIDIGAVYNISPLLKPKNNNLWDTTKVHKFYPVQRELIFDIDLTDYDDIRSCCSEANICLKCWKFMALAVKIIDAALREDFGFRHILWTFSGRRGIHCWVCDEKARFLRKSGREAVAEYLQIVNGGVYMKKKVNVGHKLHRSVRRALEFIEPVFINICVEEQNFLGNDEKISIFLGILNDDMMRDEVKVLLDQYSTSYNRWKAFVNFFRNQLKLETEKWCETPFLIEEIMIQYLYPRLDINVSLGLNHLLKSPFCIHPKTGRIGVPLDPKTIDQFDLFKLPSVETLLNEIDEFDSKRRKEGVSIDELKKINDIQKTSLRKYYKTFQDFLDLLESSNQDESTSLSCDNSHDNIKNVDHNDNSNNNDRDDNGYASDVSMDFD